jgi:hypothetical protein
MVFDKEKYRDPRNELIPEGACGMRFRTETSSRNE